MESVQKEKMHQTNKSSKVARGYISKGNLQLELQI